MLLFLHELFVEIILLPLSCLILIHLNIGLDQRLGHRSDLNSLLGEFDSLYSLVLKLGVDNAAVPKSVCAHCILCGILLRFEGAVRGILNDVLTIFGFIHWNNIRITMKLILLTDIVVDNFFRLFFGLLELHLLHLYVWAPCDGIR